MSIVKVKGIAHVRLRAPDLDQAEAFLSDFGLLCSARRDKARYFRGTGPGHHVYVVEKGKAAYVGHAFHAAREGDLAKLARAGGASPVERIDEPGGGLRVRLTDPDGFEVEVVHGIKQLKPRKVKEIAYNLGPRRHRFGEFVRVRPGPSSVKRLGHIVVTVKDFKTSDRFYKSHLGFLSSDELYADGDRGKVVAAFNRLDRGRTYVDHHAFLTVETGTSGLQHAAFEVENLDALMLGHDHLKTKDRDHVWGIGRHILGSHIFDYWRDPWGRIHEHWTDTDLVNADRKPGRLPIETALEVQWGAKIPAQFL